MRRYLVRWLLVALFSAGILLTRHRIVDFWSEFQGLAGWP